MIGFRVVLFMSIACVCHGFNLKNYMSCNASLTGSCSSSLYVPKRLHTLQETASLFHVSPNLVNRTADGYVIAVNCSCLTGHNEYVWHMDYTVQRGDTWDVVSSKFGSFVVEMPEKTLTASQVVTLDILCGCTGGGVQVITYSIQPGDTLFTVCSHFGADVEQTARLNSIENPELIITGDIVFIPAPGLKSLILPHNEDSSAREVSNVRNRIILGATVAATAVVILNISILLWVFYFKRKGRNQSDEVSCCSTFLLCNTRCKQDTIPIFNPDRSTVFSYHEVCNATNNFNASQKIGQGAYGSVYLGQLKGTEVAIKQMKNTKSKEFLAELNILCKVHHTNLIELIGYAAGGDSLFLVYEYAHNGALSDHLHSPIMKGYASLSLARRVQIALDAAKGLEYIHMYTKPFYVHRDIKTSNILLDSNFRAKIADFGLVKLLECSPEIEAATSKIVGTFGYLAPEYARDGRVTTKSDVYAFGVVVMELLTGKPALSRSTSSGDAHYIEHRSLVDLMLAALEDKHNPLIQLMQCIDPHLVNSHRDTIFQMALLSKDCVDDDWNRRPDMCKVVLRISHITSSMSWEGKKPDFECS